MDSNTDLCDACASTALPIELSGQLGAHCYDPVCLSMLDNNYYRSAILTSVMPVHCFTS